VALNAGDLLFVDEPYQLLLSPHAARGDARSGVGPDRLRMSFGPQFGRKGHSGDAILEAKWQQACAHDPGLVDGLLFRLEKVEWTEDGTVVLLCLGLTSIKEYIGSNRLPLPMRQIRRRDGERNEKNQDAHMSNPIGCEALLVTSDEKVALMWCTAETSKLYPDRFGSRSGGRFSGASCSPEPERAGVDGAAEATAETRQRIAAELFEAALRGVQERTSVPRKQLTVPRLIGCMSDSRHYKPELLFLIRTSLDAAAVRAHYAAQVGEGGDPDTLDFWPVASVSECPLLVSCTVRAAGDCMAALAPSGPVWGELSGDTASAPAVAPAVAPTTTPAPPQQLTAKAAGDGARATQSELGRRWVVVGGGEKGIIVRQACDLKSPELLRLAHGARVEEVERSGDRLRYNKLHGDGPDSGWVSVVAGGKELLMRE